MDMGNSTVLYGTHGVCRITGTTSRKFGDREALYYVLEPVYGGSSTIFVPVDNPTLAAKMRRVLSAEEIYRIIRAMPDEELIQVDDSAQRRETYNGILRSGDRMKLVQLIKTLYCRQQERREQRKKPCAEDERFMKEAEKMLYEEFAYVLNIRQDQVLPFILEQIQIEEKAAAL
ncbi:MAG: CarD family transcriptional regulator [Candidatus Merdivicinus sp.]|jgi:CarD family transcriptional regulator